MTVPRRALMDSRVALLGRRLVADSRVCAAVGTVIRPTVAPGLQWTAEQEARSMKQLQQVVQSSWLVATVSRVMAAAGAAWRDARFNAGLTRTWGTNVASRVQMGGLALVTAVLTHIVLLAVFGVHVSALGWSLRVALVTVGGTVAWRPGALADAVKDKARRDG